MPQSHPCCKSGNIGSSSADVIFGNTLTKVLITGDSEEVQVPGGFGACGQPNDGFHQHIHALRKAFANTAVSWSSAFDLRKAIGELQTGAQSSLSTKALVCHRTSIYAKKHSNTMSSHGLSVALFFSLFWLWVRIPSLYLYIYIYTCFSSGSLLQTDLEVLLPLELLDPFPFGG